MRAPIWVWAKRTSGQLKLYLRPDWPDAGSHLERALAIDPNEPLAHAYLAFLHGMLGNLVASKTAAVRAVSLDPVSLFVRAVSVMGFPVVGIPGADSAAALDAHETAIAMDPNSVLHLWMSAMRLGDFGRHEEAVARVRRAVELTQRAPLIVGMCARALALAGRREETLALRAELRERAQREYVGPAAMLMMVGLDLDDEAATAALLEANIEAMTGPAAIDRGARAHTVARVSASRAARAAVDPVGDSAGGIHLELGTGGRLRGVRDSRRVGPVCRGWPLATYSG